MVESRFTPGTQHWVAGLDGLRNVVRQELVARQLAQVVDRPVRVLDAGCGQGTQAIRLARAGHEVVGLDVSDELLDRFRDALAAEPEEVRRRVSVVTGPIEQAPALVPGAFDLVCCHGVLMYVDDPAVVVEPLVSVLGPGGRLSLLVRNGLAPAMRDGLRGQYAAALAAFDTLRYTNRVGVAARADDPADLDRLLERSGLRRERWWGVRVFTDHVGQQPPDDDVVDDLLAAEEEAGRRDPYRQVAALLHLVYR